MPKTAVQTPVCDICGADARKGSLFCYNCGGSLKPKAADKVQAPTPEAIAPTPVNGTGEVKPAEKSAHRRRRKVERGPVEVVWEPREGISVPFVIVSVILLVIASGLFVLAMWLR